MVTSSGRCHGPGCTQTAVTEHWCSEHCCLAWHEQFRSRPLLMPGVPVYDEIMHVYERLQEERRPVFAHPDDVERVRHAADRLTFPGLLDVQVSEAVPPGQVIVANPSALRRLVDNVPPAMLAVGAASFGAGAAIAKAAEVERLNDRLRRAFLDHAEEALAEARRRAHTSLATYAQAVESMWSNPPEFASANAEKQQVASIPDPARGWLSRWFDRLFGRTT